MKRSTSGFLAAVLASTLVLISTAWSQSAAAGLAVDPSRLAVSDGDVTKGEVLLSMPVRYLRTGKLENEIRTRGRPWAQTNVIPAGTPVFAQTYEELGTVWCAVADWNSSLRSICFEKLRSGSGRAHVGMPYAAPQLEPGFFLESPAEVVEDLTAEFPPMEMVYVLDRWTKDKLRLWRGLRIAGTVYRDLTYVTLNRVEDGSAGISISGYSVRVLPAGSDKARAELGVKTQQ